MVTMKLFTIGFTKKSAEVFFNLLRDAGIRQLVDVRLNNSSQLSGFAKQEDLKFFLREIGGIEYHHELLLAPTQDILDAYKKNRINWSEYEREFLDLIRHRQIEKTVSKEILTDSCLLCSEDEPHYCHRRIVAEYLSGHWGHVQVKHLHA